MSKSITAYLRGVTATVALCATGFAAQAQELLTAADVAGHTPDAKNGEQVYNAAGCATCHSVEGDLNILAGGRKFENRLGTLFAPNITNHSAGIGSWSDVDFVNAVLRGQSPEGEQYISAFFPYPAYARMSVEDALDLRAYIKTLPESDAPSKDHKVNRLGRTAFNMQSTERAPLSGAGDEQMKRGEYLAEALGHCGECHTPRKRFSMDLDKRYQGYLGYFGEYAPDISPTRLANIDAATFAHGVLVEGKKLNGRPIAAGSMRRIVQATQKMSREDRAALFAYLSKKPVDASTLPEVTLASATGGTATVAPPKEDPVKAKEKEKIEEVAKKTGSEGLMMQVSSVCDAPEPEAAVALTAASSAEVGVDPEIERAADRVMDASCRTCHGPGQRNEKTFPMHDIVDMARDPSAVKPGDPEGSNLYQSIAGGRMPLGPQMTPEDVDAIRAWIVALGETAAAAPAPQDTAATVQAASSKDPEELPTYAGGDFTTLMLAAVTDLDKQSERSRPYIRYLDFSNTPLPQVDCDAPPEHRNPMFFLHAGLNKFINSVSRGETLVPVTPVDGTDGALVRIDIRDYGWDVDDWRALSEGIFTHGAEEAGFDEKAWEELAVVYPYAMDPHSDAFLNVLAKGTHTAVPILNADWFTHFGSTSPYYDVLLRLPEHIRILERRLRIDVDREILDVNMIRAGFAESGVSDHNRMLERFDLKRNGYYWKSYDFAGDDGQQLLTRFPDGPAELGHNASGTIPFEHDGGEMIFSLENGMQGYYLSTAEGERLLVGPTSIVSFRNKPIGRGVEVVNARSCFDCHENGIIRKNDELRNHILTSNAFNLDQREVLLEMYPEQEVIDKYYKQDSEYFIEALDWLGVTQKSAAGTTVSLRAPQAEGGGEIVTYLADLQFRTMDLEAVARAFYLTPGEFADRINTLGDSHLIQLTTGWMNRFNAGLEIARVELDEVYADLLPRMTDYDPFRYVADGYVQEKVVEKYEEIVVEAIHKEAEYVEEKGVYEAKKEKPYEPDLKKVEAYVPPKVVKDPLHLSLAVPYVNVKVNDLLEFDISANKRCELQVLYVEETKNVEELPPEVLGPAFLEAGEVRRIPYPGSGFQLRFDTPGKGETMIAFCRAGGLGDKRIDAGYALNYAKEHFQPLSRGIVIERTKEVAKDEGQSAVHAVTFQVSK